MYTVYTYIYYRFINPYKWIDKHPLLWLQNPTVDYGPQSPCWALRRRTYRVAARLPTACGGTPTGPRVKSATYFTL